MNNMTRGTRFYYTGDMANADGEGSISRVIDSPKWGLSYDLTFDDGRLFRSVSPLAFEPGSGRRFWPLDEWQANRAKRIAEMQARMSQKYVAHYKNQGKKERTSPFPNRKRVTEITKDHG